MKRFIARVVSEVGPMPLGASALLAGSLVFLAVGVTPLEHRVRLMERELAGGAHRPLADGLTRTGAGSPEDRLSAFYGHLERGEDAVDWLAKLHGIAQAQGLESRAGDYRLEESRHRLDRYRVTLPFSGSYAQIRAFLSIALAECPVLAVDQVTFRRRSANDPRVEAEVALTLYLRRSAGE